MKAQLGVALVLAAGFALTSVSAAIDPTADPATSIWRRHNVRPAWIIPAFSRVSASFRRPVPTRPRAAGAPAASTG